jgi:predicted GIY-YIG superfamily endonuclease
MAQNISKYQEIMDRLNSEKKVESLDKPKDIRAIEEMNKEMEAIRRDYQIKERQSQYEAQYVVLNS